MTSIQVMPVENERYEVAVGGHRLTIDQPKAAGGDDKGPTPVQLFAASVASHCTVYHSLQQPPTVSVLLSGSVEPAGDPQLPSGRNELVGASAVRSTCERDLSPQKRSEGGP
jgi:hypothetical protein